MMYVSPAYNYAFDSRLTASRTILTVQQRPIPGPNGENYVQSCDGRCE